MGKKCKFKYFKLMFLAFKAPKVTNITVEKSDYFCKGFIRVLHKHGWGEGSANCLHWLTRGTVNNCSKLAYVILEWPLFRSYYYIHLMS